MHHATSPTAATTAARPTSLPLLPETITYQQAVERYKCDRQSIRKAILDGKITSYKPGKSVLIDVDTADRWFMSTRQQPPARLGRPRGKRRASV